jgi:Uma2 family endonuclease
MIMAVLPARRRFTVSDYHRMGKAGILAPDERVELIEGEIVALSPIGRSHASVVLRHNVLLSRALQDRALVSVQNPLGLSDVSEPVPDILVLRPRDDFYLARHPSAADVLLLVEISDTTLAYDRGRKLPVYAREGVPEVWIADLRRHLYYVYRDSGPEGYRFTATYRRGDEVAALAFPDVEFSVSDLLG